MLNQDQILYNYELMLDEYGDVELVTMHWKLFGQLTFKTLEMFFEASRMSDIFSVQ